MPKDAARQILRIMYIKLKVVIKDDPKILYWFRHADSIVPNVDCW